MESDENNDFTCPSCGHDKYELTPDTFHGQRVYNCAGCGFPFLDVSSYPGRKQKQTEGGTG